MSRDNFASSFPVFMLCIPFSCLVVLFRTCGRRLKVPAHPILGERRLALPAWCWLRGPLPSVLGASQGNAGVLDKSSPAVKALTLKAQVERL